VKTKYKLIIPHLQTPVETKKGRLALCGKLKQIISFTQNVGAGSVDFTLVFWNRVCIQETKTKI